MKRSMIILVVIVYIYKNVYFKIRYDFQDKRIEMGSTRYRPLEKIPGKAFDHFEKLGVRLWLVPYNSSV